MFNMSLALVLSEQATMEAVAKNSSRINRRLLQKPLNDHSSNQAVDRILVTLIVAMAILSSIVYVLYKFCFLRSDDSANENPTDPKPSIDVELEAIPVIVFGSESNLQSSQPSSELESCAICLEEYVNGDRVRVLPRCKHMFHKSCIEKWLQVPSLQCPICRDRILEHCLQSAGTNNCRTQTTGTDNFNIDGMRYIPFPSLLRGNFV